MAMKKRYQSVGGRILSEKSGGARVDYLTDALGSVTCTVDQSQTASSPHRYAAYGKRITASTPAQSFQWVGAWGYRRSSVSGLDYVRARHYRSVSAAWTSVDLLWPEEYSYLYSNNRPLMWADPSGLGICKTASPCAKDPCDYAKNVAHEIASTDRGATICCDGIKYACEYHPKGTDQGIRDCTVKHEQSHFSEVECPPYGYSRPPFVIQSDAYANECLAHFRSIECLKETRKFRCGPLTGASWKNCIKEYHDEICMHCTVMRDVYHCQAFPRNCNYCP